MKLIDRMYRRGSHHLPGKWAGLLDLRARRIWESSYGPLNGQPRRREIVREMLAKMPFDSIVETGTYLGETTAWLHHVSGLPTYSAEISPRFFTYATSRCRPEPGIHIRLMDSRDFLRQLAPTLAQGSTFFYLDAHWLSDVPRITELEFICENWERAAVVIDDFRVPGDSGYEYAHYNGKPLDEAYIPLMPNWRRMYPAAPAESEALPRRGMIALISPALASFSENLDLLKPAR